jgi:hypothetical protein
MNTSTSPELQDPILEPLQSAFQNLGSGHASWLSKFLPGESQLLCDLGQRLLAVAKDPSKGGRKPKGKQVTVNGQF